MTTLTVEQLQKWYRKRLKNQSKDFIKLAEKSYKLVERNLKDIEELSKELKGESEEDSPDSISIATRFAMKIREIVDGFYVEKDITYEATEALQEEINHFIQELWGAGARWIRRLDKKYKNIIKQLDVYMRELAKEMKKIGKLLYEYSWVKDLERIGGRIKTLQDLTYSRENFQEQIRQVSEKINTARGEYSAAKKAYEDFTEKSNVAELLNIDEESDHVAALLRMKLNPLKKQVKKFLQHDTGVRIGPAGQKALSDYFENPLNAITEETEGYPNLIEGLSGLKEAIEKGSLQLKDRLARRAIEEIEAIGNGSLKELQEQAKGLEEKRHTFAGSDLYTKNKILQDELDEAKRNLEYHSNDMLRIRDDIERELERVKDFKSRIESEILESFNEKVVLEVGVTLEPLLEECNVD